MYKFRQQFVGLVGVQKAGTTWLHQMLANHPQVHMSAIKEPNFFCDSHLGGLAKTTVTDAMLWQHVRRHGGGHAGWIKDESNYVRLLSAPRDETVVGEASVSYFCCRNAPHRLAEWCPAAKIIVIVRDPIARAWSHASMDQTLGKFHAPVSVLLGGELRELRASNDLAGRYLRESFYAEALKRYIDVFSRERLLILPFADIKADPNQLIRRVAGFLEVRADLFNNLTAGKMNAASPPRWPGLNSCIDTLGIKHLVRRISPAAVLAVGKNLFYDESGTRMAPDSEFREAAWPLFQTDIDQTSELVGQDVRPWYLSEYAP